MKPPKVYPMSMYGDPSLHVKFEQETCKGCRNERFSIKDGAKWCIKINRKYGKRCKEYAK